MEVTQKNGDNYNPKKEEERVANEHLKQSERRNELYL